MSGAGNDTAIAGDGLFPLRGHPETVETAVPMLHTNAAAPDFLSSRRGALGLAWSP